MKFLKIYYRYRLELTKRCKWMGIVEREDKYGSSSAGGDATSVVTERIKGDDQA